LVALSLGSLGCPDSRTTSMALPKRLANSGKRGLRKDTIGSLLVNSCYLEPHCPPFAFKGGCGLEDSVAPLGCCQSCNTLAWPWVLLVKLSCLLGPPSILCSWRISDPTWELGHTFLWPEVTHFSSIQPHAPWSH
jgi:hypothetical protein